MPNNLITNKAVIGVYDNHADADRAVAALEVAGVAVKDISVIGGDDIQSDIRLNAALGRFEAPAFVEKGLEEEGGRRGALFGGMFGMLIGFGSFFVPGIGLLVVLGPIAGLLGGMGAGALMGSVFGDLTFNTLATDYRTQLVNGNFLVIVHCDAGQEERVENIMESTQPVITRRIEPEKQATP